MGLGDGGRPQRSGREGLEDFLQRALEGLLQHHADLFRRHGARLGPQPRELCAIGQGQHVAAHGHNLAQLDKGRPQILQNTAQLFRRDPVNEIMPQKYAYNLFEPTAVAGAICGRGRSHRLGLGLCLGAGIHPV